MNKRRSAQCSATKAAQQLNVIQRAVIETILTRMGIALFSMKLDMNVPSRGWFINHRYRLSLPFRKSVAASRSSGVVGSTGRNAPNIPSPSDMRPNIVRSIFTVFSPVKLSVSILRKSCPACRQTQMPSLQTCRIRTGCMYLCRVRCTGPCYRQDIRSPSPSSDG